jgi:hypothetical protein
MERVRGIEPPSSAWEAAALPLSYTRDSRCCFSDAFGNPPAMVLPQLAQVFRPVGVGDNHIQANPLRADMVGKAID